MSAEGGTPDCKRVVLGLLFLLMVTLAQAACVQFC
jgi:hypothetical protein